jgi:PPK2 family polyphosphate:nucleotide phosphotransferase
LIARRRVRSDLAALCKRHRVANGATFRLENHDPDDDCGIHLKERAKELLAEQVERIRTLQEILYAQDRWALLLVFQAMDAAGKDSAIKHVLSCVNPHGVQVHSFKVPTAEELDHDYLWRTTCRLPERGRIGIFSRSYYEEVLVVRVHPEILKRQRLAPELVTTKIWQERYEDIRNFERYLARNGTVIRKFFMNMSKDEQRKQLLQRIDEPEKNWKFAARDIEERDSWAPYQRAYADAIRATARPHAPWYVVPADKKWYGRLVIAGAVREALESLKLRYPRADATQRREMAQARRRLDSGRGRQSRR